VSSISPNATARREVSARSASARFYELDLLRQVAALAATLYHRAFRGSVGEAFIAIRVPEAIKRRPVIQMNKSVTARFAILRQNHA